MLTRLLPVTLLMVGAMAAAGFGLSSQSRASKQLLAAPFENMVRITPQRIPMAPRIARLCDVPQGGFGPHGEVAEVHIYANQLVVDYRRAHPNAHDYPLGSKFVKEKYSGTNAEEPSAATIMERRGTTGNVSDWRFSIVSLPDKIERPMTGKVSCASCHENYQRNGYVSYESENALKQYLKIE